jgi:hypothetical protein
MGFTSAAVAQDEGYDAGAMDDAGAADDSGQEAVQGGTSGQSSGTGQTTGQSGSGQTDSKSAAAGGAEEEGEEDLAPAGQLKGQLARAIREMIRLLEAQQYESFLDTFLAPEDKAQMLRQTTLQSAAGRFGANKAVELLGILKSLRAKIPRYTSDGSTAAFTFESGSPPVRSEIRFQRIQGAWYLKNN